MAKVTYKRKHLFMALLTVSEGGSVSVMVEGKAPDRQARWSNSELSLPTSLRQRETGPGLGF